MSNQGEHRDFGWAGGELRALHYYSWLLTDEKRVSVVLLLAVIVVCALVWRLTEQPLYALLSAVLLIFPIWRTLVPVHFEINSDGIARWNFGRRRLVPWEEIKSYEILPDGVLLLPNRDPYPLEPFHGLFVPVPNEFQAELKYRLRFFVDKMVDI